jgi:hypothetical protein
MRARLDSEATMTPAIIRAKRAARNLYDNEPVDVDILRDLETADINIGVVTNLVGPICHEIVSFFEDGTFDYDPLGTMAFLFVVVDVDAETELDIVAWSARDPSTFGTLLDQAALIGAGQVLDPATYYGGQPCRLYRTPLAWLQAGCTGAVVLQAIPASAVLAKAPGPLAAEDPDHARALVRSKAVRTKNKLLVPERIAA